MKKAVLFATVLSGGAASSQTSIALLAVGSSVVQAGDSKIDLGSSPGVQNFGQQALDQLNARLRYSSSGGQGKSGNTVAQLQGRIANVTAQQADITIVAIGHNSMGDVDLTTQLGTLHTTLRAALPNKIILWTTVLPSYCSDGSLYPADNAKLLTVNDWIMAKHNTDSGYTKSLSFGYRSTDPSVFDPQTMCYPQPATSPVQYIHPNEVGGAFCGTILKNYLDTLVTAQTYLAATSDTGAAREHGANLDTKWAMSATTEGTTPFAGTGSASCSGSVPVNFTLTNNTTATIVASIITASDGTSKAIQLDITGTVSVEGNVTIGGKNATAGKVNLVGVAGDYFEGLCGYKFTHTDGSSAPVGIIHFGYVEPTSSAGLSMNLSSTATTQINGNQTVARGFHVARTYPRSIQSFVAGTISVLNVFGFRLAAGTVNIRLIFEFPMARKTEVVAYTTPAYIGLDTIHGSAEQIGVTGTVANTNVLTFRPGSWAGGGGGAMFKTVRIYQAANNTTTAVGSGSLLATVDVSAGVWTWTASGLTTGSSWFMYPEVDANNGIGGIVTQRGAPIPIP